MRIRGGKRGSVFWCDEIRVLCYELLFFFLFLVQSPVSEATKPIPNEDEQNGEEPDDELELPPPMKPISESILVNASDAPGVASQRVSTTPHEFETISSHLKTKREFAQNCLQFTDVG